MIGFAEVKETKNVPRHVSDLEREDTAKGRETKHFSNLILRERKKGLCESDKEGEMGGQKLKGID